MQRVWNAKVIWKSPISNKNNNNISRKTEANVDMIFGQNKIILQWGSCSYNWNIKNIMQYNHFKLITTIFLSFCLSSLKAYPVHDFQIASVLRCLVRAPPLHESKWPHTTFSNEISLHTLKYTGSNISKKIEKQSPRGVL